MLLRSLKSIAKGRKKLPTNRSVVLQSPSQPGDPHCFRHGGRKDTQSRAEGTVVTQARGHGGDSLEVP